MSHARTTIKNNIKTAITGLLTTGANVYGPEVDIFDNVPCLQLFTSGEEIDNDPEKTASKFQERNLSITINGAVKMSGDVDATLDNIAAEVETAIFTALEAGTLGNLFDLKLITTDKDYQSGLEKRVGIIEMLFECQYLTREGTPQTSV